MEIKKYRLANGPTIVHVPTETNSVALQVLVNVGSINENKNNNGISHFIEHLLFKGSKKFKTNKEITHEIEKLGGYINAYTSKERTCFHIKILNKHFDKALDVLLEVVQNPLFREKDIEKERDIISREIDIVFDDPRFYQWILLNRTLYEGSPIAVPTYGSKEIIMKLTKKDILDHYLKYYEPGNIIIIVVGKVSNIKNKIERKFKLKENKQEKITIEAKPLKKVKEIIEKRKIASSYLVLGYRAPKRTENDSYVLDIIHSILGKGMSGRLFDEIRNKRGLAYDVGSAYISERDYAYFTVYANVQKKNIQKVKDLINKELKLRNLTEKELKESKDFIEGNFYLVIENTEHLADIIGFWEQTSKSEDLNDYVKKIKKVSLDDVKKAVKEYFSKPYAIAIIEGEN
ncbi:MAG: insulinase family protein [Candidatus Woesearchaeota archaeon]|nr:MAG: insulinase family protein [Candidatus Woesearchaeota archaeon]